MNFSVGTITLIAELVPGPLQPPLPPRSRLDQARPTPSSSSSQSSFAETRPSTSPTADLLRCGSRRWKEIDSDLNLRDEILPRRLLLWRKCLTEGGYH